MNSADECTKRKINLTLLNGTGYVFEIRDYIYLRKNYRIIGACVGSCSVRGWSAQNCTLPIELTLWETELLLNQGLAVLLSKTESLLGKPSLEEIQANEDEFQKSINEQAELMKRRKIKESERNMDKIIQGKRKKLMKSGVKEKDIRLDAQEILKGFGDSFVFDRKNALLEIPCAHPHTHVARIIDVTLYDKSCLKYRVFKDFWLRGKFITCGDTFGADFLLYPGDPLLYHASHIVILLDEPKVPALDLVAKVRLSVSVNKYCVFAYFDSKNGPHDDNEPKICYQTVFWEGNQEKRRNQFVSVAHEEEESGCNSN